MSADAEPQFTRATLCGHHIEYEVRHGGAGIEWCPTCQVYVGVIVLNTTRASANVRPLGQTHADGRDHGTRG